MRRPSVDAVRGFDRAVYVVAGGRLLNSLGSGLVYPFATIYFHLAVGIPLSLVGAGLLANYAATALGTVVGGSLADGRGRKPVMVASMLLAAVTLAGYAFVVPLADATVLTPALAFGLVATAAGFSTGLYAPAAQAMTADLTPSGDRDGAFSLLKVASNVGFGTGLVLGGLLYEVAHVAVFLADGATSALVAVVLALTLPRVHDAGDRTGVAGALGNWARAATDRRVLALAVLNVAFTAMYAQMQTTIPVLAKNTVGLDAAQLGALYALNPLTLVLLQIPLVDAVAPWRRTRGLVASAGFWAASMLAAWAVGVGVLGIDPWLLGVALVAAHLVLRTVGEILHAPLMVALGSDLSTSGERGSHLSLLEVAKRLGMGLGSFVGGLFFDYGLADLLWPTLAAVCGLLVLALVAFESVVSPAENGVAGDGERADATPATD